MRLSKKCFLAELLKKSGLGEFYSKLFPWSGALVLNYHRIGDGSQSVFDRGLWSATEEDFAAQLRYCKAHADVISPADLPAIVPRSRGRYVMITFDDGYRDNYMTAFPLLKQENLPATFFVTTGFVDEPRLPWWDEIAWMARTSRRDSLMFADWFSEPIVLDSPDRELAIRSLLRKYKTLPAERGGAFLDAIAVATGTGRAGAGSGRDSWMTWDMLREMQAGGMVIGGHTVTHPVLAGASPERQQVEISDCGRRLADELGVPMRYFSYPVGGRDAFNVETRRCLCEAGVQYAFSYYGGFRKFNDWDDHDIRRVAVESDTGEAVFRSVILMPQVFAKP